MAAGRDAFEPGEIDLNRPRADDDHVDQIVPHPRLHVQAIKVAAGNRISHSHREQKRSASSFGHALQHQPHLPHEVRQRLAMFPLLPGRLERRMSAEVEVDPIQVLGYAAIFPSSRHHPTQST